MEVGFSYVLIICTFCEKVFKNHNYAVIFLNASHGASLRDELCLSFLPFIIYSSLFRHRS